MFWRSVIKRWIRVVVWLERDWDITLEEWALKKETEEGIS
jgi:hypothetical protein